MVRQELRLGKGWVEHCALFDDEALIGYILIRFDEDLVDITRLGVHPEVQGKGIGSRLLQKALQEDKVLILTVQKDNVPAMKLYFKYGFEIVGHLHSARAWIMRRKFPLSTG